MEAAEEDAVELSRRRLSPREWLVCGLVLEGLTNKEIAARLRISVATVNHHVHSATRKSGARSKVHLAVLILRGAVLVLGGMYPELADQLLVADSAPTGLRGLIPVPAQA